MIRGHLAMQHKKHHLYLEDKVKNTGWIASQFLKLRIDLNKTEKGYTYRGTHVLKKAYYACLMEINKHKIFRILFNFFYVYNFIGTLTGEDQKLYCWINDGKTTPRKITIINSIVFGFIMTLYYYGLLMLMDVASGKLPSIERILSHLSWSVIIILSLELLWDVWRIAYALATGKGKEPVGLIPLIFNGPTYVKRILRR
jgi:hypothetical protein